MEKSLGALSPKASASMKSSMSRQQEFSLAFTCSKSERSGNRPWFCLEKMSQKLPKRPCSKGKTKNHQKFAKPRDYSAPPVKLHWLEAARWIDSEISRHCRATVTYHEQMLPEIRYSSDWHVGSQPPPPHLQLRVSRMDALPRHIWCPGQAKRFRQSQHLPHLPIVMKSPRCQTKNHCQ